MRLFSSPVVRVDSLDHDAKWGLPLQIKVVPGPHQVAVGAHYCGSTSVMGTDEARVDVAEGREVAVEARNGFFNHQPFVVTERTSTKALS